MFPATTRQIRLHNLDLLRFLAAWVVLFSHSWPLALGPGHISRADQLAHAALPLFVNLGEVAVGVFFILSGFLITRSLLTGQDYLRFLAARVLRIYPAILVNTPLVVFGLGLAFTSLPALDYLTAGGTWSYLFNNMRLFGIDYTLPGVFSGNPYPNAVNGALWTLPYELGAYALTAGLYAVGILSPSRWRSVRVTVLWAALAAMNLWPEYSILSREKTLLLLCYMTGTIAYVTGLFQSKQHIGRDIFVSMAVLALWGLAFQQGWTVARVLGITVLADLILLLALQLPQLPFWRADLSYGMYIYAFPVQQMLSARWLLTPVELCLWATLLVLPCAWLSWTLVEQPMLAQREVFSRWLHRTHARFLLPFWMWLCGRVPVLARLSALSAARHRPVSQSETDDDSISPSPTVSEPVR
jgi:peptidoglycan/LPS O-acetylase OafA/YrhL